MGKTKTSRTSEYTAISKNIYFDGASYRVRVSINGEKYSRNCKTKREAYATRKQLLGA